MKEIFTSDFWMEAYSKLVNWVIVELPGLILVSIFIFILFKLARFILNRVRRRLVKRAEKGESPLESEKRINTLIGIVKALVRIILWATYIMILLRKFGIDIAPIIASAGIVGLAVGFGAQELVRDFISGFFILLENQIRIGDVAVIDGTGGLVEKIELRTTTIRDFEGVVHVFQNGKINSLSNRTKEWSAILLDIGVAYKEDTDRVIGVMKKVGEDLHKDKDFNDRILEPIEIFGLDQFADSAIVIRVRLKTKTGEQWNVGREYRKRLKYAFDEQNIEIPFPHTTIYWGDQIKPLQVEKPA